MVYKQSDCRSGCPYINLSKRKEKLGQSSNDISEVVKFLEFEGLVEDIRSDSGGNVRTKIMLLGRWEVEGERRNGVF